MEVIIAWIVPLLAAIALRWSAGQFSLVMRIDGRMKWHFRRPATKGAGRLAWYALPISTSVLIGYAIRAVVWAQAHWALIGFFVVVVALITAIWHWRSPIVDAAVHAMTLDEVALERRKEGWRNQTLPDQMNNG